VPSGLRTGVAYLGQHNPRHLRADLEAVHALDCDDVLLAVQEIDFVYFPGKFHGLVPIAADLELRPLALLWGALNLFGGGRSSQFLLDHPECHQAGPDGSWRPGGCYNHPDCVAHVQSLIDRLLGAGLRGYLIDEPPLLDCWCRACERLFEECNGLPLRSAHENLVTAFRRRCVTHYVEVIARQVKAGHPEAETFCCIPPEDRTLWPAITAVGPLDNVGTDLYWANTGQDLREVEPLAGELATLCRAAGKRHHQWLQCWGVRAGNESRIRELGRALCDTGPDALYVWAFEGQVGTSETCDNPERAWATGSAGSKDTPSPLGETPVTRTRVLNLRQEMSKAGFGDLMDSDLVEGFVRYGTIARARKAATDQFGRIEAEKEADDHRRRIEKQVFHLSRVPVLVAERDDFEQKGLFVIGQVPFRLGVHKPQSSDRLGGSLRRLHPCWADVFTYWFLTKDGKLSSCTPEERPGRPAGCGRGSGGGKGVGMGTISSSAKGTATGADQRRSGEVPNRPGHRDRAGLATTCQAVRLVCRLALDTDASCR
jgi:hypothetical protein